MDKYIDMSIEGRNMSIWEDAVMDAHCKIYKQYNYDRLLKEKFGKLQEYTVCRGLSPEDKAGLSAWLDKKNTSRYRYILLTVNFKEGVDINDVLKKIEKCLTKRWIVNYMWCLEWRDLNKGMHCHMRLEIKGGKQSYRCKGEVYNTFKHLVGNKNHIHAHYNNDCSHFDEYIKGYRNGKPKETSKIDAVMRKKYELKNYYVA